MQQHPVFVLFDPHGDLEQREDDRPGLSRCQRGALQPQLAQLLVQHICPRRQQQTAKVGEERLGRSPVGFQVAFHLLDPIFRLPARAIILLV